MTRYQIITLIDITRSNPNRAEKDPVVLGQQANFNSLIQGIGMRANVEWEQDPVMTTGTLPHPFEGRATYWTWDFLVEREQVFERDNDPVALLVEDLHNIPVVSNLLNDVELYPAAIQTQGDAINTYVNIIR
jgi:hypothetical protein